MTELDKSDMANAYKNAIGSNWHEDFSTMQDTIGVLSSQVLVWQSRANYLEGKVEGLTEVIEVLKGKLGTNL